MPFITTAEAKLHLRVDGVAEDALIGIYIAAAEASAVAFIDRAVYADQPALDAALATAPAALSAATLAYDDAIVIANALPGAVEREAATLAADNALLCARMHYRRIMDGMMVNEAIRAAILLTTGHLYANREDVVTGVTVAALPNGAQYLLQPYRVGMGV